MKLGNHEGSALEKAFTGIFILITNQFVGIAGSEHRLGFGVIKPESTHTQIINSTIIISSPISPINIYNSYVGEAISS